MRGWAWIGSVVLLAACTRDNGAFDESAGGGTASTTGSDAGTTRTDGVDGPPPGTGSASGTGTGSASGVDGNTADDAPPPTTGPESTSEEVTTMPPEGTSTTGSVMEEGGSSTTGFDDPITCCMGESCNDPGIADACVCIQAPECCGPEAWNLYCTAVATQGCGLMCVPPPGDCCEAHEESPGCGDFDVMACVCSADGNVDCCSIGWTAACAAYADKECMSCG